MSVMNYLREDVRMEIATKILPPTKLSYALCASEYNEVIVALTDLIENDGKSDTFFRKEKLSRANTVRINIEGVIVELIKTEMY